METTPKKSSHVAEMVGENQIRSRDHLDDIASHYGPLQIVEAQISLWPGYPRLSGKKRKWH